MKILAKSLANQRVDSGGFSEGGSIHEVPDFKNDLGSQNGRVRRHLGSILWKGRPSMTSSATIILPAEFHKTTGRHKVQTTTTSPASLQNAPRAPQHTEIRYISEVTLPPDVASGKFYGWCFIICQCSLYPTVFQQAFRKLSESYQFIYYLLCNDHVWHGLSQWETTLQCNVVSHWLSPFHESSL